MLPKIDLPIFELTLPSTGEKIKYRVFTVKEEKILLVAKESGDIDQIILAIEQVLGNCLVDKKLEDLAVFDIEYLLIMIRSKSVNNTVDFIITDPDTQKDVKLRFDLEQVKIHKNPDHTNVIKLNDNFSMFMKYPNVKMFLKLMDVSKHKDPLVFYDIMINCISTIASEDVVYDFKDTSREDIDTFMENLSSDVIEKIEKFFDTMPTLRHEVHYTNSNQEEKTFVVEGTDSFFI